MLPGQEVNKDVYAVNTGNIAAFVKEDVSGVLNYTFESKVASWDADCVELTLEQAAAIEGATMKDGYKTMEAGGYLAWTDATSTSPTGTKTYSVDGTEFTADKLEDDGTKIDIPDSNNANKKSFTKKYNDSTKDYYLEDAVDGAKLYEIKDDGVNPAPATYYVDSGKTLSIKNDTTASPAITPGPLYSGRTQDLSDPAPWTPTETGTYIFRRSIGGTADVPTFEYAGYYYDEASDKYYKIVIGDDAYRAAKEGKTTTPNSYEFDVSAPSSALAGVTINKDGEITAGTPKISFVKDTKVTDQKVTFKYEDAVTTDPDGNNHGPRLVALYAADAPTTTEGGVEYDASAYAARKEVDYINKLGEANKATIEYNQKKAEYDYATALLNARNTLIDEAVKRKTAYDNLNGTSGAAETFTNEWKDLIDAAGDSGVIGTYNTNVKDPYTTTYAVNKLFTTDEINTMTAHVDSGDPNSAYVLPQAAANIGRMQTLEGEIAALDANLWTEIQKLSKANKDAAADARLTPAQVDTIISNIKGYLDDLSAKVTEYNRAYSAIKSDPNTATLLNLNTHTDIDTALTNLANTTIPGLKDDLDADVLAYKNAYNAYQTAKKADKDAADAWADAITEYNNAVNESTTKGAKSAFDAVMNTDISTLVQPVSSASYDPTVAGTIVPTYSANKTASGTEPKIDVDEAKTQNGDTSDAGKPGFATIAGWDKSNPAAPTTTDYSLNTLKDAMDTAVGAANTAKSAYDDAKDALDNASTIKIYVNLAENYATNWQIDDADKAGSQNVDFYLKKILEAGETSEKLIDSVELADTTTARDYKDLTFDLNVGLDSAQITYANDQRTITTEAVKANDNFILKPTAATYADVDAAVAWGTPTP